MPKLDNHEQDVDALIGDRIRVRRVHMGLSQADLAALIGMSFQQVQKYERGANRIASSILLRVASALECPPAYLLGAEKESKTQQKWIADIAADRETAKLMQRFYKIKSPKVRRRILLVLDALLNEVENIAPVIKTPRTAPPPAKSGGPKKTAASTRSAAKAPKAPKGAKPAKKRAPN